MAFVLAAMVFAVMVAAHGRISRQADDATYCAYRSLPYDFLMCCSLCFGREVAGSELRGSFKLRRGQIVEVISDADPLNSVRCSVVWIGKAGSKQEGEVGLETTV